MAEITKSNSKRVACQPPRVDLTPLVDLGFLLITFFVFTATLNNPTSMTTLLPADSKDSTKVSESGAVTLLAAKDKVFFYIGNNIAKAIEIDYQNLYALRGKLIQLQHQLLAADGNDDKLFVMIKPSSVAEFGDVVNLLDEMKICQMKRYTLADPTEQELRALSLY